jgi:hypothetical protein
MLSLLHGIEKGARHKASLIEVHYKKEKQI